MDKNAYDALRQDLNRAKGALQIAMDVIAEIELRMAAQFLGDIKLGNLLEGVSDRSPIAILGLPGRPANCLRAAGISTIDQLLSHSRRDLFRIPNCGNGSIRKIDEALSIYGLRLRKK